MNLTPLHLVYQKRDDTEVEKWEKETNQGEERNAIKLVAADGVRSIQSGETDKSKEGCLMDGGLERDVQSGLSNPPRIFSLDERPVGSGWRVIKFRAHRTW